MSDSQKSSTLCERCSLLSFDDAAIGGQEVVGEDGVARLSFPESKIELRPADWQPGQKFPFDRPDYQLVRLDWKLDETLSDLPYLSRSSQLGCTFCQALRKSLEEKFVEEARARSIDDGPLNLVAYLSVVDGGIEGLVIEATFNQASLDGADVFQTIFPIEADSNCCDWLGAQSVQDASYLHPTNILKMRQLLDHCTSKCHPHTPSLFMPTRLIDIGHHVSALPRLVPSSNIRHHQQTKYAALSYCWGTETDAKSQFKTEKASLEYRCAGLPSELLTPTTNVAIALTRAIGLRYLWIDALCIIQDDRDDWLHESSQMNLVYRHAFVTFCTLNSNSCHESFLRRAPAIDILFQSTIRKAINGSYLVRLRPRTGRYMNRTKYAWDIALSKWDTRCWTFQEQEMSTRLLLFGSLKMHFACAECKWSEGDDAPKGRSPWGVMVQTTRFEDNCIFAREIYKFWYSLVRNYGRRSVTFDKDRLPAIAGLARIIGEALQDQYLAGLWRGDFLCGLAWNSVYDRDMLSCGLETHVRHIRERNYVAPSWSWAACPAVDHVRSFHPRIVEESAIVDVKIDTDPEDLYGQISGGFLRIRGKMARMPKWFPTDQGSRWSNAWFRRQGDNVNRIHVVTDWLHKDEEAGLDMLIMMLLYRIEHKNTSKASSLQALLLYPADEVNHYYRVGVTCAEGHDGYREMRAWFENCKEETICII